MNIAKYLLGVFFNMGGQGHRVRVIRYTGEELRAIRKRNGVGRPPKVMHESSPRYWSRMLMAQHVNMMAARHVNRMAAK